MGISAIATKEIVGLLPGGRFGQEIRDLGDINPDLDPVTRSEGIILEFDDNNDDFAVSAPGDESGKVFIFFGSVGFPAFLTSGDADIVFSSPRTTSDFGSVLQNLGDINEDELNDIGVAEDRGVNVLF